MVGLYFRGGKVKDSKRYEVSLSEDFEPGSDDKVLKNFLGIKSSKEMDLIETQELARTEKDIIKNYGSTYKFTIDDICGIHDLWLGPIYPFSGKFRSVNMSKNGFPFAAAERIDILMREFERNFLCKYTPCNLLNSEEIAYALGVVHTELVIIHPFREGNGRVARLLSVIMALQSNLPPLNFTRIDQFSNPDGFQKYISAIHAGHGSDYQPIQNIFYSLIKDVA